MQVAQGADSHALHTQLAHAESVQQKAAQDLTAQLQGASPPPARCSRVTCYCVPEHVIA